MAGKSYRAFLVWIMVGFMVLLVSLLIAGAGILVLQGITKDPPAGAADAVRAAAADGIHNVAWTVVVAAIVGLVSCLFYLGFVFGRRESPKCPFCEHKVEARVSGWTGQLTLRKPSVGESART